MNVAQTQRNLLPLIKREVNMNFNYIEKQKDTLGKIVFLISVLFLVYLFISPLTQHYVHIDERFTISLLNLSFDNSIDLIIHDVHPPLYYLILIAINTFFSMISNNPNLFYIDKIISIIPYAIILLISYTKIRKDYSWFTAGLFTFTTITMSNFFIYYLTIRMYSWCALFVLLSFICIKGIIEKNRTYWILFTLLNLLGLYTHYIAFLYTGLIYLLLIMYFIHYKTENRKNIKNWVFSVIGLFIAYLPWLLVLINQIGKQGNGRETLGIIDLIHCLSYFSIYSENIFLSVISILFLVLIVAVSINKFVNNKNKTNLYVLSGIVLFFLTLIVGTIVLPLFFAPITPRYLIPTYAVLWLCIAILMDKIENKKLLTILLILLVSISCINMIILSNETHELVKQDMDKESLLKSLNNEDTIIIYNQDNFRYVCYHNEFKKAKQYSTKELRWYYDNDCIIKDNITDIIKENPDKKVYVIDNKKKTKDMFGKDIKISTGKTNREFILVSLKK